MQQARTLHARSAIDVTTLLSLVLPSILIAALLSEWCIVLTRSFSTGMGQDSTTLYAGALAWLHGANPYSSDVPNQLAATLHIRYQGSLEQPLLLALYAPLTVSPPRVAYLACIGIQDIMLGGGALLLARTVHSSRSRLLTLAVLSSPPAFLLAYYGQVGALVYGAAAAAWWARERGHSRLLGICIAASLLKPQLGLITVLPLLWGSSRRTWIALGTICIALLATTIVMMGPGGLSTYLHVLHAFTHTPEYRRSAEDGLAMTALYQGWLSPWLADVLTHGIFIAVCVAVLALVARYRTLPSTAAVILLIALLVLVLPYSHQYDSIILLPALIVTGYSSQVHGVARPLYWLAIALVSITPLMAVAGASVPFRLLPLGVILWVVYAWKNMSSVDVKQRGVIQEAGTVDKQPITSSSDNYGTA